MLVVFFAAGVLGGSEPQFLEVGPSAKESKPRVAKSSLQRLNVVNAVFV